MVRNLNINSLKCIRVNKTQSHRVISALKKELDFNIASLQINFVNSEYILPINKEYLNHNNSTDIITFDYSENQSEFIGEIYISVSDAERNAASYNVSLDTEILRLIIHGILHLLGFNDLEKSDKKIMKAKENELVEKLNIFGKNIIVKYDC